MAVSSSTQLWEEVRLLRGEVEALRGRLERRRRVTLHSVPSSFSGFLGQAVTVMAKVTDGRSQSVGAGVPVTVAATWGKLRAADGYSFQEGSSVTVRTGVDGTVRVTLHAPTSEDIWDVQQAALEVALAALDPHAATPHDTEAALADLVRQYRWDAGLQLRNAIDIYFRDFHSRLLDTVNYRDYMEQWSYIDSLVVAYVPDEVEETAAQAVAMLSLRFKDWLGPWLETYLSLTTSEGKLGQDLSREKTPDRDAGSILEGVYGRVRDYVAKERGRAGALVARKVAETSVREFVTTGVADLPLATRTALYPALETATAVIASAGDVVLSAVGQARTDLRREVDAKVGALDVTGLAGLAGRVGTLETQVAAKADTAALQAGLASKLDASALEAALAGKVDVSVFESTLKGKVDSATFEAALGRKADTAALQAGLASKVGTSALEAALSGKADRTALEAGLLGKVDTSVFESALKGKVDVAVFQSAIKGKVDTAAFDAAMRGKVDTATFEAALGLKADTTFVQAGLAAKTDTSSFQSAMEGKVNVSDFISFQSRTQRALDTKADSSAVADFQRRTDAALAGKVDSSVLEQRLAGKVDVAVFNTFSSTTDSRLTALQSDVVKLNTSIVGLTGDFARFQTTVNGSLKTLSASTTALSGRVDGLQGTVARLDTSVTSLGNNVLSLKTDVGTLRRSGPIR